MTEKIETAAVVETAQAPKVPARKFYSASAHGFFSEDIHGEKIPADAVEIAHDAWLQLLQDQGDGKQIVADANGKPMSRDPVYSAAEKRERIGVQMDAIRNSAEAVDALRGALLGKSGAKEALQGIDDKIESLRATLPSVTTETPK
jgi:hypothetical protein